MIGPEVFLNRLNKELNKLDLPNYKIYIPLPKYLNDISHFNGLKIGRLDGSIYYKLSPYSLRNLVKQRLQIDIKFIELIPNFIVRRLEKLILNYLNRNNKKILNKTDIIVYQSQLSKEMHEFFWGKSIKKTTIIYNGVEEKKVEYFSIKDKINLVITARFRLNKRLAEAIRVLNLLNKKNKLYVLHVVGDLDFLTKKSIKNLDLKNVNFHGNLSYEKMDELYRKMHIGLSPSMFDPCPNSAIEMMSYGIPVITTSASGVAELVSIDELIVSENLPFKLYEIQNENKIPSIDYVKWKEQVEYVVKFHKRLSNGILKIYNNQYKIKDIASQYSEIILSNSENNGK